MRQRKITPYIRRIILKEKRKNPLLGCRKLSSLIKEKYNLSLSKSLINKILVEKGIREKKGRKKITSLFKRKEIKNCGVFLFKGAEFNFSLDSAFIETFYIGFPKMRKDKFLSLIKFFLYFPLSGTLDLESLDKRNIDEFKKISGCKAISKRNLKEFSQSLKKKIFYLAPLFKKALLDKLIEVIAIKINFLNGFSIYMDPLRKSIFSSFSGIPEEYYTSLGRVEEDLERIFKEDLWVIMSFPCFGEVSSFVSDFFTSSFTGVKTIEILGRGGRILKKIYPSSLKKFNFIIGFSPKVCSFPSLQVKEASQFLRFNLSYWREVYIKKFQIKFLQFIENKKLTLTNVLFKIKREISWGLFTNIEKPSLSYIVDTYTFFWPYLEEGFLRHLEIIEKSTYQQKLSPLEIVKEKIKSFSDLNFEVLRKIIEEYTLLKFFSSRVSFRRIYSFEGWIEKERKKAIKIFLKNLPSSVAKNFNEENIYWKGKKIFLNF
jgi:hypothetical protein